MDVTTQPLFRQIAKLLEDSIADGILREGGKVPSTNELAAFHGINPATARKGLALLVDAHIITKQRGVGMFVAHGAAAIVRERRRAEFTGEYVAPLVDEAARIGLTRDSLHDLVGRVAESRGLYG